MLLHLHSKVASYIIHPSKMTRQEIDASETCCRPMTATNPTIILTHSCKIHKIMACLLVFLKWDKELGQVRMTEAKCEREPNHWHVPFFQSHVFHHVPIVLPIQKEQMIMWVWLSIHVHVFALFIMLAPCHLATTAHTAPCMHWPARQRPQNTYAYITYHMCFNSGIVAW